MFDMLFVTFAVNLRDKITSFIRNSQHFAQKS